MLKKARLLIVPLLLMALFFVMSYAAAEKTTYQNLLTFGTYGAGEQNFKNPYGLDVDPVSGDIYVADTGNSKIKKFNRFGGYLNFFGSEGTNNGQFLYPQGIVLDGNNNIYVADTGGNRIQKFHIDGNNYTFTLAFGSEGSGNGQLRLPRDVEIDINGNVYVCDSGNNRIVKFNSSGSWIRNIGENSSLSAPYGLALDKAGNIYVADTFNNSVVKFAPDGTLLMEFGDFGTGYGQFTFPRDVALDKGGNIFVADTDNHRIQKFNANGEYINSFGVHAEFLTPQKIVIDGANKLHAIDSNTNRLQVYDVTDYIVNVYAEPNPFSPDGDGFVDTTSINYTIPEPARITITIYDANNNLIRNLITGTQKITDKNADVWDGKDNGGVAVSAGVYTFKIDAVNALNYHPPQQSGTVSLIYPTGTIIGSINDGVNPISGATVSDGIRSYPSDANGNYTIPNVPAGIYMIIATKTGCVDASRLISLQDGETITGVNLVLDCNTSPANSEISGTVTDGISPLTGATVTAGSKTATTDSNGYYTISELKAGTYTVTARRHLCSEASENVLLGTNESRTGINFTLGCSSEPDIEVTPKSLVFTENLGGPPSGRLQQAVLITTAESPSFTKIAEITDPSGQKEDYEIKLKSGKFAPVAKEIESQREITVKAQKLIDKKIHLIIQLEKLPNELEKEALKDSGIELLSYLPNYAWIVSLPAAKADSLMAIPMVRWAGTLSKEDKISSRIQTQGIDKWARNKDGSVNILVQFFKDVPWEEKNLVVANYGGSIKKISGPNDVFTVSLPEASINGLADEDIVQWIEEVPPPPVRHNDGVRESTKVNTVQVTPYDLSGSGVVVGIWDSGHADAAHDDFGTRVEYGDSGDVDEHATHVAGIVGGNGTLSQMKGGIAGQWAGMAPNVRIISYEWTYPVDEHYPAINNYGIDISQNSWGYWIDEFYYNNCSLYGDYSSEVADYDSIVKGAYGKHLNIVFSAGDNRINTDCDIPQNGGYKNIPPPATGKNIITVGAINSDDDSMTSFSSWGPVADGRLKPDVVAPGCEKGGEGYIHSTLPGDMYGGPGWCGTSMAAPAVSGTAALMIEQFRNTYGVDPLPSTIKGVLIHTAQDVESPGPDFKTGYGKINAKAAVDIIKARAMLEATIAGTGETDIYSINIPEGSPELKVTLAWDDQPGTSPSAADLVNDLDLALISPSGFQYKPWLLDPNNPSTPATTGEDHINNVEQVYITNPMAGLWTVRVTGRTVPYPVQGYSLVSNLFNSNDQGYPPDWTLSIYNKGTRDLVITNISKTQSWLSIDKTSLNIAPGGAAGLKVTVDKTGLNPGTYTDQISISSNDPDENVVTIPVTFAINAPNDIPIANPGGPYAGTEGRLIVLNGSGSTDSDGSIVRYEWDINNDGIYDYSSSLPTQSLAFAQQGNFTIKLRVTDNYGATGEATTTATIVHSSPTANFTASSTSGIAPMRVNFSGKSTGYGRPFSYAWDFDNNGTTDSTEQNPSFVYYSLGTYSVKLTVTDSEGSSGTLLRTNYITISNPISINGGATYTINATVSLALSCSDSSSLCAQMQFSNDNASWSTPEAYATNKAWTLIGADGTKTVYVKYQDNAGNWSNAYNSTIILDTLAPNATINDKPSNPTKNSSVNFSFTSTEPNSTFQCQLDGGSFMPCTSPMSYPVLAEGSHTFSVKAKDEAGNEDPTPAIYTWTVDMTAPAGSIIINAGATYANTQGVDLGLNAMDVNGVLQMQLSNDGTTWSSPEAYNAAKNWTLSSGDGPKIVYAKFKDRAGNWSGQTSDTIVLDTTPPGGAISVCGGTCSSYINNINVTLLTGCYDNYSSCTQMQFSNDNVTWSTAESFAYEKAWTLPSGDGPKTVYAKFKDGANNWSDVLPEPVVLDTIAPSTNATPLGGSKYNTAISVTLTCYDGAGSGCNKIYYTLDESTPTTSSNIYSSPIYISATKTLKYFATDRAGNHGSVNIQAYQIAPNLPTGSISINNDLTYTNSPTVTLTLSCTYSATGCTQMQFSNDNTNWSASENYVTTKTWTLPMGNGTKTVYGKFKNGAGNWLGQTSDYIVLDTTPPFGIIAICGAECSGYTNNVNVTLRPDCDDSFSGSSGCTQMQFRNDNGSWSTAESFAAGSKAWTLPSGDGTKAVYAKFKDGANNWSSPWYESIKLDTTLPTGTIVINGGTSYTYSTGVSLTLSCSDSNGCTQMKFSNDNIYWSTPETYVATKSWTLRAGDGTKAVYVKYKDAASNWSLAYSDAIVLDTALPTGTIVINGGSLYTKNANVTLTLSCSDSSTCAQMKFSNDNIIWSTPINYSTTAAWNIGTVNGDRRVYVKFKDSANKWSVPFSNTIFMDTLLPGVTASPAGGFYNTSQTVALTCTDGAGWPGVPQSGCSRIYFTTNGTTPTTASNIYSSPITIAITTSLRYFATDLAGNSGYVSTQSYTIETTPPTGGITINGGANSTDDALVTLTLSCSDSSGCSKMQLSNDSVNWSAFTAYAPTVMWTLNNGDGNKTIYVKFMDRAGNWSIVYGDGILLDTIPPATTTSPPEGFYPTGLSVSLTCNDGAGSGCSRIYYATPITMWSIYAQPISITATTILQYFATDLAGNLETISDKTYYVDDMYAVDRICVSPPHARISAAYPGGIMDFSTLQQAYDAAIDGDIIQTNVSYLTENLTINRNISITLQGGYDCSFNSTVGKTTLQGNMDVLDGIVLIDNFVLE